MGTVYLAANSIAELFNTFGHLQLVYESDAGVWTEVEVQAPNNTLFGEFVFHPDGDRAHGTTEYVADDGTILDASNYKRIELDPNVGQTPEQLWQTIRNLGAALAESAEGAEYDVLQNSNSYAVTILEGLGYEADDLTGDVTPGFAINHFPGAQRNLMEDGVLFGNLLPGPTGGFDHTINVSFAGSNGNDVLVGGRGADDLFGRAGNDLLVGGRGNDDLDGGSGQDAVAYFDAGGGVEVNLTQQLVADTGGQGQDRLNSIEDVVGSDNRDEIAGNNAGNLLVGLSGRDTLNGSGGDDTLMGGASADVIRGGTGEDLIAAGTGNDQVWGGSDSDIFYFVDDGAGTTINDFELGIDFIFIGGSTGGISQVEFDATGQGLEMQFSGNTVVLEGVFASITADHFIFG